MDISNRDKPDAPPRILQYRKHVRAMEKPFKYFAFFYFLIFLGTTISYFWPGKPDETKSLELVFSSGILWIIIYLEYKYLIRPLAISKVQVYSDRIFIERGKEKINILFNEITEIKSTVNKNIGGWFKVILKNKKSYRFTIVLERVDYVIDGIIKFNPLLLPDDVYKKLRKNLILSDHGWARYYDLFQKENIAIAFLHLFIIPLVLLIAMYFKQRSEFLIHNPFEYFFVTSFFVMVFLGVLWTIFPFLAFRSIDKNAIKRIDENPNNKIRDSKYEVKIYKKLLPAYLTTLVIFFGVIYQLDLNTISVSFLRSDAKYLNVKADETLWVDKKYNCLECKHKLNMGDIIITNGSLIGKIVAMPKDQISLNDQNKEGRYIASTQEKEVPPDSLAIQTYGGETILLVNINNIRGKISKVFPAFNLAK